MPEHEKSFDHINTERLTPDLKPHTITQIDRVIIAKPSRKQRIIMDKQHYTYLPGIDLYIPKKLS